MMSVMASAAALAVCKKAEHAFKFSTQTQSQLEERTMHSVSARKSMAHTQSVLSEGKTGVGLQAKKPESRCN